MIPTPHLDDWTARVARQLSPRGAKADLARHLATQYGGEERAWQVTLNRIIKHRRTPNGEVLLAINAWFDSQTQPSRPPKSPGGKRGKNLLIHK